MPIEVLSIMASAPALSRLINERLARGDAELLHITPYQDNGRTTNYMVIFQVPELAEASLAPGEASGLPVASVVRRGGGSKTRRKRGRKCRTSRKH